MHMVEHEPGRGRSLSSASRESILNQLDLGAASPVHRPQRVEDASQPASDPRTTSTAAHEAAAATASQVYVPFPFSVLAMVGGSGDGY